jgi:thiol-disulfide isomerase/thioredoxin
MAVLAGFCVLVAWAWAFNDLKDCGCFGKYIELGPAETIIKNLMTIVLLGVAWALAARRGFQARRPMAVLRGVLAAVAVLAVAIPLAYADGAAATADNNEGSFASYEVGGHRLEEGEYLVAILSSTCDDCAAAVPVLNEFQAFVPDVPVVGLVKGEEQSVRDFRQLNAPEFPLQPIGSAEFFGLTGDYPPRFYLVRDGVAVQYLDTLDVTLGDLLMLAGRE